MLGKLNFQHWVFNHSQNEKREKGVVAFQLDLSFFDPNVSPDNSIVQIQNDSISTLSKYCEGILVSNFIKFINAFRNDNHTEQELIGSLPDDIVEVYDDNIKQNVNYTIEEAIKEYVNFSLMIWINNLKRLENYGIFEATNEIE